MRPGFSCWWVALPTLPTVAFVVGVDVQCGVHGLNRPFRIGDSLASWPHSWILGVWSLLSGQDILARQHSRRPIGLVFALIWAVLWRRAMFALAVWW